MPTSSHLGGCSEEMPRRRLSRREWLAQSLGGLAGLHVSRWLSHPALASAARDDAGEIAAVNALAKQAGMGPFAETQTKHFLGLGNANVGYCNNALAICEELAKSFLPHFGDRGFKLALPRDRMTVITLKDKESYRTFLGKNAPETVGGHYDLDTNRLVVFDFRGEQEKLAANAGIVNLFTLVHEALHTLCFNSGLLDQQVDVPTCIAEGLATYGELWCSKGKGKIGGNNGARLKALRGAFVDPHQGSAGQRRSFRR